MIVKFQKDVFTEEIVLIKNEEGTIVQEILMTKEILNLFGQRWKMYRECLIDDDGRLYIGEEVKADF